VVVDLDHHARETGALLRKESVNSKSYAMREKKVILYRDNEG